MHVPDDGLPRLSATEEPDLAEYRPLSILAIAAFVLGLISSVSFLSPWLWLVPMAAMIAAGLALRATTGKSAVVSGRGLALIGLTLAVFFGVGAASHWGTRQWMLRRQARNLATQWIGLVRAGQLETAHQWTLGETERQPPGASLLSYYDAPEARQRLARFFDRPLPKQVAALGERGTLRFVATLACVGERDVEFVDQLFAIEYEEAGQPRSLWFRIVSRRVNRGESGGWWRIHDIVEPVHDS